MWNIRDLEFFIHVSELGSLGRAAQALHYTQPAVSKRIASLEREVGEALLTRTSTGVHPTPVGTALLPFARELVGTAQEARKAMRSAAARSSPDLIIGFHGSPGTDLLSRGIRGFTQENRQVRVELCRLDWMSPFEDFVGVAGVRADMILVWVPRGAEQYDLAQVLLMRDQVVVAMPADHPLASAETITSKDLADEVLLSVPRGHRAGLEFDQWFEHLAVQTRTVYSMDEIVVTISSGLGLSAMPASLAEFNLPGDVAVRPLAGHEVDLVALWDKCSPKRLAIEEFVRCIGVRA